MKAMKPTEAVQRRPPPLGRRVLVPTLMLGGSLCVLTAWAVMSPSRVDDARGDRQSWARRARESIDSGRGEEARADLERAIAAVGEDAELRDLLGRACLQSGHCDEAEAAWRRAVELGPARAEAWASLGRLALSRGRPAEAIEHLNQALRLGPDSIPVTYSLMLASSRLGKLEEAAQYRDRLEDLKRRFGAPMTGMVGPEPTVTTPD
jgi:Flp pilus assembly protein TadD